MAWIEQTKKAPRSSGGPQYYLQDLHEPNRLMLAKHLRLPVRLWTPYGIVDSGLTAVSSKVGSVGHDRVQSGGKVPNIAQQIAHWYGLRQTDIEHIEFDDSFDHDDQFVIRPAHFKIYGRKQLRVLEHNPHPLTVVQGMHSALVTAHLRENVRGKKDCLAWANAQIGMIISEHRRQEQNVDERDLLRASGALSKIGVYLGMYRGKGIDCPDASFTLCGFPTYPCQIEIEEYSSGFRAVHHMQKQHHKQRVVVVCMEHNAKHILNRYVDVIELRELERLLKEAA